MILVLIIHAPAIRRYECLAQGHSDEILEQPRHVQQEAVHGHGPGFMLNGGRAQDELGQPQRRVVSGVEPGRLPAGDLLAAVQWRDVAEVAEQAPQHALRLGIHTRNREHPLACRPQDPVLRDVDGELVVLDLQRQRQSMVAVQLLALAQPATQHLGTLLNEDVAGEQSLMDCPFRLPPQRLGHGRNQVRGLGHRDRLRSPGGRVPGISHQE